MTTKSDHLLRLKIISLGNVSVGKSCLIKRYCEKRFVSKYMATIGIDYGVTRLRIRNYDIRMNIFDFSGHPLFYEVRNEFYRDVQGILLVFDLTNRRSFETLDYWLCEMKKELNLNTNSKPSVVIFIIGNKNDLKRVVEENEAKLWANVRGYQYFETSGIQFISLDYNSFLSIFQLPQVPVYKKCSIVYSPLLSIQMKMVVFHQLVIYRM